LARCQDHDGEGARLRTPLSDHLEPAQLGKPEIDERGIELGGETGTQALFTILGHVDSESDCRELQLQALTQYGLVFDHENAHVSAPGSLQAGGSERAVNGFVPPFVRNDAFFLKRTHGSRAMHHFFCAEALNRKSWLPFHDSYSFKKRTTVWIV